MYQAYTDALTRTRLNNGLYTSVPHSWASTYNRGRKDPFETLLRDAQLGSSSYASTMRRRRTGRDRTISRNRVIFAISDETAITARKCVVMLLLHPLAASMLVTSIDSLDLRQLAAGTRNE